MDDNSVYPNNSSSGDENSVSMAKHSFGENLERLMKERRYTVASLAKELGTPSKTVHEWIGKGGRMPRNPEVLRQLSEVLNVSLYCLLYGEEDPRSALSQILEKTEVHTGLYEITIKKVNPKDR